MAYPGHALSVQSRLRCGAAKPTWGRAEPLLLISGDKLVEAAELSVLCLVLIQKLQMGLIEFLEKLVPADLFQTFFLRAEIDPENAGMAALLRCCHSRGHALTLINPLFDFVMVGSGMAFTHLE